MFLNPSLFGTLKEPSLYQAHARDFQASRAQVYGELSQGHRNSLRTTSEATAATEEIKAFDKEANLGAPSAIPERSRADIPVPTRDIPQERND